MLFKARNLKLQNVLDALIPFLKQSPSPSPMILEYFKETMITLWLVDPKHVNATIRTICSSFPPSNHNQFRVATEICSLYLQNLWAEQYPEEWSDSIGLNSNPPSDAVVPSLRFILSGVVENLAFLRRRRAAAATTGSAGRNVLDAVREVVGAERAVEQCVAALRAIFAAEGFLDRMPAIAAADEEGWAALRVRRRRDPPP